jgi:chemosensory pili system protein ChpA (sensor histidine kinase/response regulator)
VNWQKLFVFDDVWRAGPLMGRAPTDAVAVSLAAPDIEPVQALAPAPVLLPPAASAPAAAVLASADEDDDDGELLDIFLDEAREVVHNGLAAIEALVATPADLGEQTILRRAFHTLKGSSRMVGLTEFGEAAWSFEQIMNSLLAEQRAASDGLLQLTRSAMQAFGRWIEDIAHGRAEAWRASDFRVSADAMRLNGEHVPLPAHSIDGDAVAVADEPAFASEPPLAEGATGNGIEFGWDVPPATVDAAAVPPVPAPMEIDWDSAEVIEAVDFAPTQLGESLAEPSLELPEPESSGFAATQFASGDDGFAPAVDASHPDFAATQTIDLTVALRQDEPAPVPAVPEPELDLGDFDFGDLGASTAAPVAVAAEAAPEDRPTGIGERDVHEAPAIEVASDTPAFELHFPQPEVATAPDPEADQPQDALATQLASLDDFASDGARETFEVSMAPTQLAPLDLPEPTPVLDAEEPVFAQEVLDESVKVIGDLRLSIPLYNVFLNEADEWSRRLQTELSEWALGCDAPVPDMAVVLAHSLQGSSATVGFSALSGLGRALEHALEHVQLHRAGTPAIAAVFLESAEDIRRLLHQFAAGFLKEPTPGLQEALQAITDTEFPLVGAVTEPDVSGAQGLAGELPEWTPSAEAALQDAAPQAPAEPVAVESAPLDADLAPTPVAVPTPLVMAAPRGGGRRGRRPYAVDHLDADLFPIFEEEAQELLPQLAASLRQWMAHPEDMAARNDVLRVLHTLKGSARLAGAMRLGEMAHNMETSIEHIGAENLQAQQIEPLQMRLDRIQACFVKLGQAGPSEVEDIAADLVAAESEQELAAPAVLPGIASAPVQILPSMRGVQAAAMVLPQRQSNNQTVRVRSRLLDRLVNQAGEVLISRSRMDGRLTQIRSSLEDLGGNLERLRQQLRDVELQSESQMQSRLAQTKDTAQSFDPLEFDRFTRVQELTRMMAESVHDVATVQRNLQREIDGTEDDLIAQGRQARELQRDLLRTRMVEFDSVVERLYGVVRQAGKDTGKQVKLDIIGGSIEMDRGVLERMVPAFEHMLRNAVSHGIEDVAVRSAAGKPAVGTVVVQVDQHSNDVSVSFSDDGGGLHLDRIRERALANGLIGADQVLSTAEAANLIFMPGFSTAEQVTELSGRGIGMDVVRAEVSALGGRIETSTEPGSGSHFKLVLPLTTAVTQVVMMRMGELTLGVPSNLIETVQRAAESVVDAAYANAEYFFAGEPLPFYWAGALLQVSARSTEPAAKTQPVVILRSAGQRLALHVDEVLGNREVVVKNLGPQLARLPGLTGMSVLASGAVVLIYNPVALASVYGEHARALAQQSRADTAQAQPDGAAPATLAVADQLPLVLVVDDSITVRRVTQRLLKREGYRVAVAADGLQALELLMEERPAVVLSDIEMPRMDGFDLARNIRGDVRLKDLPIIMITSRIAQKHRDHAKELGVDHYLGKPYSEEELLALVQRYTQRQDVTV